LFDYYLQEKINKHNKLYYNYLGISKKDYPKWGGWKIILKYKNNGVDIKEIDDPHLDLLVHNFYYLKYLEYKLRE